MRAVLCRLVSAAAITVLILTACQLLPSWTAQAQAPKQLPAEIHADQTPADITITGGFAQVTGIGDFNGDGASDFLVKYERWVGDAPSLVFFKFGISFGKRGGTQPVTINLTTDEPDLALTTKLKPPFVYSEISTLGDINGDGLDDIVLEQNVPAQQAGQTSFKVFFSSRQLQPGVIDIDALPPDLTIIPPTSGVFNSQLEAAADVNGDGAKDLLLSINSHYFNFAAAILLGPFAPGTTIDLGSRPPDVLIEANNRTDIISRVLLADVNGDGKSDVLIKRRALYSTNLDMVFGSSDWKISMAISLTTQSADATLGVLNDPVVQVADLNGDGIADILIGSPAYYGVVQRQRPRLFRSAFVGRQTQPIQYVYRWLAASRRLSPSGLPLSR